MVRSLWTAATGMIAQQTNVDTIANNLANVNTVGYKTKVNEFKSLLYQNLQTKTTSSDGTRKPSSAQVGLGVRNASVDAIFKQGAPQATESDTAFAIDGEGFFAVRGADGENKFTRNGNFVWAIATNNRMALTSSDGLPVLDSTGRQIVLPRNIIASRITVTSDGTLCYPDENNNPQPIGVQIGVFQFNNPSGLDKEGDSLYTITESSGPALNEATNANVTPSKVLQGYLEASNVQVVDEMVNLIVAQRAYEMNSKAITASDEMLQQANSLRR